MEYRWIFGLSLDEKIEWCFSKVFQVGRNQWVLSENPKDRIFGEIVSDVKNRYKYKFQELLEKEIRQIVQAQPTEVVNRVYSVGVSIVGLADRKHLHLVSIARKPWGVPGKIPVVDFRSVFRGVFENISVEKDSPRINIHNESTAKCLAEWNIRDNPDTVKSLFYVMFWEGVNGGFVANGQPLYTELHTELGHILPRPHLIDFDFKLSHSGCSVHKVCFEGLCSGTRIRKTWSNGKKKHLSELPEEAWDVISFYVAQMCMNGVLAVSPARILLGGETLFPELLSYVKEYFKVFNQFKARRPYITYDALKNSEFIGMAKIPASQAGIAGALELARLVEVNEGMALRLSLGSMRFTVHEGLVNGQSS